MKSIESKLSSILLSRANIPRLGKPADIPKLRNLERFWTVMAVFGKIKFYG
jgi:hypothetical protein